jgi:hypothetical protein
MNKNSTLKISALITALIVVVLVFYRIESSSDILKQLWSLNQLHYFEFKAKLKSRVYPKIEKRTSFISKSHFSPGPMASIPGGFYKHPVLVSLLSEDKNIEIFYTLDGSIPTKNSFHYHEPIAVKRTIVLRFRSFKKGYLPGLTKTHTYFLNTDFSMPVLSIVCDPVNLWNKYSGIYANPLRRGKKWERKAHIEYFNYRNELLLRSTAEIRIHGGYSRIYDKKSFRIRYPLSSLKTENIDDVFVAKKQELERTIVVRSTSSFRLRDPLFHVLYSQLGGLTTAFSPVMVYLNGKIWGIYNIHERIDEQYLRKHIGPGEYRLIRNLQLWKDEAEKFQVIVGWFNNNYLSQEEVFKEAAYFIDIENITDYWIINIYAANLDWPHSNVSAFKRLNHHDSRWRFIAWDADDTFGVRGGYDTDSLEWATRSDLRHDLLYGMYLDDKKAITSTLIMRKLLTNSSYRWKFINRFCDLLNSYLSAENVENTFNRIIKLTAYDQSKDMERWSKSEKNYLNDIKVIRTFIRQRPEYLLSSLKKKFHLGELLTIELHNQPGGGVIQINTIKPDVYPWKGKYFEDATITLSAVPSQNYRFVKWTDSSLEKSSKITFTLNRSIKVGAIFEQIK